MERRKRFFFFSVLLSLKKQDFSCALFPPSFHIHCGAFFFRYLSFSRGSTESESSKSTLSHDSSAAASNTTSSTTAATSTLSELLAVASVHSLSRAHSREDQRPKRSSSSLVP